MKLEHWLLSNNYKKSRRQQISDFSTSETFPPFLSNHRSSSVPKPSRSGRDILLSSVLTRITLPVRIFASIRIGGDCDCTRGTDFQTRRLCILTPAARTFQGMRLFMRSDCKIHLRRWIFIILRCQRRAFPYGNKNIRDVRSDCDEGSAWWFRNRGISKSKRKGVVSRCFWLSVYKATTTDRYFLMFYWACGKVSAVFL